MNTFKVGNYIKGINNYYGITNGDMLLGEVIRLSNNDMFVKILNHVNEDYIGEEHFVRNSTTLFSLVESDKVYPKLNITEIKPANIKDVYFNDEKETVVIKWDDDSITKVKTSDDDIYSRAYGFLLAFYQERSGLSKNKANRYLYDIAGICSENEKYDGWLIPRKYFIDREDK